MIYHDNMNKIKLKNGIHNILELSHLGNQFINESEPWVMIKTDNNKCKNVINVLIHLVGLLGRLLEPYMPNTSKHIFNCLNYQYPDNKFKLGT